MRSWTIAVFVAMGFAASLCAADVVLCPPHPAIQAIRLSRPVRIDGVLDDEAWRTATPVTRFLQREPEQGAPPRQSTEVWVAYDEDAIYFAARCHDLHPDSVLARLTRRDNDSRSDAFYAFIDPLHDHRTGYYFGISAAGTLYDGAVYNDGWDDDTWDGVWEARARRDGEGWSAEMRVPFSQLRYQSGEAPVWGVNFKRDIPRYGEEDWVIYPARNDSRFVSIFPELTGLTGMRTSRSLQVLPYVTGKAEYLQRPLGDPFNDGSRYSPNAGVDLRTSLGSKLTLNATINPDFGQVEVDPAVVNLSDAESFFNERRPFFVENNSIFNCGNNGANDYWNFNWPDPKFFYTRRIGGTPGGHLPSVDDPTPGNGVDPVVYESVPLGVHILGAAKVTGQLAQGWNFGAVQALTGRERADRSVDGFDSRPGVEPLTYYGVLRGMREFRESRHGLGLMTMSTARRFNDAYLRDDFNSSSVAAIADGWTFLDTAKVWVVSGWAGGTTVQGSPARMVALQTSSQRYYQRPDAAYLGVDSSATSLNGYGARLWLNKQKGPGLTNAGLGLISPGFEENDLGFQTRADIVNGHIAEGYRWRDPGRWTQNKMLYGATAGVWDYQGNRQFTYLELGENIEFRNRFSHEANVWVSPRAMNPRITRGGPRMETEGSWGGYWYLDTDGNRTRFYAVSLHGERGEAGSWSWSASPTFRWKPVSNVSVELSPEFDRSFTDAFYVDQIADPAATLTYGTRYVFANLEQNTFSAGVRLDWAFTPNVTLQFYGQPLVASGRYGVLRSLAQPGTRDLEPFTGSLGYTPDFNFRSLRGNAVARWEYAPGSTLFFVWTQDRAGAVDDGAFQFRQSLSDLAREKPNNIFLVKVAYHFDV